MNKMPHIQLDSSVGATAAILPGDPARVDAIAAFLTDVREEAFSREYKSITGTYKGTRILAISTGMGGASTAICVEELADLGFTDLIRIGSCGALQSHLTLGQLVLCDRAVCDDGTSQTYLGTLRYAADALNEGCRGTHDNQTFEPHYVADALTEAPAGTPAQHAVDPICGSEANLARTAPCTSTSPIRFAYGDRALLDTCVHAAQSLGFSYAVGPTRCHDALYLRRKPQLDEFYSTQGIYASDMETAALFAVGALRGVRTASILNVVVEWKKDLKEGISSYKNGEDAAALGERNEIIAALEALHRAKS